MQHDPGATGDIDEVVFPLDKIFLRRDTGAHHSAPDTVGEEECSGICLDRVDRGNSSVGV